MKLHSPRFQRQLRRKVKAAVRESRSLRKEYRQGRKFPRRQRLGWLVRGAMSLGFGMAVSIVVSTTSHPTTGLAAVNLWLLAWVFLRAAGLANLFHGAGGHVDGDVVALRLLPVSEATIFRWQWQKFLRRTAFSLLDLLAGFGALALFLEFSPSGWAAVPLVAVLAWATLLALAALCAAYVPRSLYQFIAAALPVFGLAALLLNRLVFEPLVAFLDRFAPDLNSCLPTGWPVSLFEVLLPEARWSVLVLLLPITLIVWSLGRSLKRLRSGFRFEERIVAVAPDIVPTSEATDTTAGVWRDPPREHVGPTAIEELVASRRFLEPVPWDRRGWFERRLWNWLNAREKALSEFAFPDGVAITFPWRRIFRNLLVVLVAGFAFGAFSLTLRNWILGAGLLVTGFQALARMLASGEAFRPMFCSGVNIPIYASFGVGYRELAGLLMKCSTVQLPLFIPFILIWSIVIAYLGELPWGKTCELGFKAGMLLFAARFILILFAFSHGSDDSTRLRLRTLVLIPLVLGLGAAFLGLGFAGMFVLNAPLAWMLWLAAFLDAYLLFRLYGWFHNANRFDLMSLPRS